MNYSIEVHYKAMNNVTSATVILLQCDNCYFKVRQVFIQSATILLQSVTGITKCDDYHKVRQNIHVAKL